MLSDDGLVWAKLWLDKVFFYAVCGKRYVQLMNFAVFLIKITIFCRINTKYDLLCMRS